MTDPLAVAVAPGTDLVPPAKALLLFVVCAALGWYLAGRHHSD
ncbi:hypothetical protein QEZ54_03880 [Catellatospora sp. KI3]|nr:hypothetical protein [Catellatospora sp. KI3]MDI1460099.1 hypothetical protein [Catellatospora sp. KI3]